MRKIALIALLVSGCATQNLIVERTYSPTKGGAFQYDVFGDHNPKLYAVGVDQAREYCNSDIEITGESKTVNPVTDTLTYKFNCKKP